jgi:predicted DNA-binding transcriptional regulator AlpA
MEERPKCLTVPELAGLAEVAAILGVSRQRVRELAERDDFPQPVAQLSGGAVYVKSAIEAFNNHWNRKSGRPGKYQTQVLDELAHIPKINAVLAQQMLRMIYNNTRLHDLSRDALTTPGRTLFHAIKLTEEEFENFEPHYDQSFFQPEPPDRRYAELHAECCPSLTAWMTQS